ncbi:MAG: nucleotidyltransferase domain-containing protein [Caulobacteraceae bacterium]|nr:nucleotidyltransferase domain-containing protein [Caulobacteraceae bacterium]
MARAEVLAVLKSHEQELRGRGVAHAALFGSLARGEAGLDSDMDVFLRFEPDAKITLWDYAGLKRHVARMLKRTIDVIDLTA